MKSRGALVLAVVVVIAMATTGLVLARRHTQTAARTSSSADRATVESVSKVPDCSGFQETDQHASDNGLSSTDAKFCDEQAALRDGQIAKAKAENDVQRTGTASSGPINHIRAAGWAGEVKFSNQNDWEPDIAADPNSGYVYALTTEFGNPACGTCPRPAFVLKVSNDFGATWGAPSYVCKCKGQVPGGGWQYDPTIAVDNSGKVYVTILSKWHSYLTTSIDHGQTWSPLVDIAPNFSWTDHEQITISPNGQDVYVAFNHADSYVVASHDGGATFSDPVKTNENAYYYWYHYKGTVLANGTVVIPTAAVSRHPYDVNQTRYYALRSTDGGVSWRTIQVAPPVPEQPNCYTLGCRHDHWGGLARLASNGDGTVAYAFVGPKVPSKGQQDYVVTSTDGGKTWGTPTQLSQTYAPSGRRVVAIFPAITGIGQSGFGTWWMDDLNGHGRFNIWYRYTVDNGAHWTLAGRISDATSGAPYKNVKGFMGDYGDYGGIATMSNGKVIADWGEAFGYQGPGNTWINRQT